MKKMIGILLCLTLMLGLLAGCGEKEDVYVYLTAEEADLELAPNVVLEPDSPPYNLGGWTMEDDVWWYMNIPEKDDYTLRFWYSMPGEYESNPAYIAVIPEEGDILECVPEFYPTSAPGTWNEYGYVETQMELPAGDLVLSVMALEIPEGQDYFINLRSIEIYNGEAPALPESPDVPVIPDRPDPEPQLSNDSAEGWWVRPEGYESDGISLVDYFLVEEDSWTAYNEYGYPFESYSCWMEDGTFYMDLGGIGPIPYMVTDGTLVDPDDGSVDFVWTEEPDFKGQDMDFAGSWYRFGDPENPSVYELTEDSFQKIYIAGEGPSVELEGGYTFGAGDHGINDLTFHNVEKLALEGSFAPYLYPFLDGAVLIEEESFDYAIYVREEACDPEFVWLWSRVEDLMNSDMEGKLSDGTSISLSFEPFCFYVCIYGEDGSTLPTEDYGTWVPMEDGSIELTFNSGEVTILPIDGDEDDPLCLPFRGEEVELEIW